MSPSTRAAIFLIAGAISASCQRQPAAGEEAEGGMDAAQELRSGAPVPPVEAVSAACKLKTTEPEIREWTAQWDPAGNASSGEGPVHAHSVYWATEKEREIQARSNVAHPLDITCSSGKGEPAVAVIIASFNSAPKDIPLGPGTYQLVGKQAGATNPGEFLVASLVVGGKMYDAKDGTFRIDRFDMTGVAGWFTIDAVEIFTGSTPLKLQGRFDIPCRGGILEGACQGKRGP